jgi:hypothetical protein
MSYRQLYLIPDAEPSIPDLPDRAPRQDRPCYDAEGYWRPWDGEPAEIDPAEIEPAGEEVDP